MRITCLPVGFLLIAGCSSGGSKPAAAAPAAPLAGQWIGVIDPSGADPKNPDAVNAVMAAKTFEAMSDLQFPSESRFAFNQGGALIEGSVSRDGGNVTLNPETVNGLDPAKARLGGVTVQTEADAPMTLTLNENGAILTMPKGPHGERLMFLRYKGEIGPDATTPGEKGLLGRWGVQKMEGISAGQEQGGFDYLLKRTAVNLQRDHKFQMRFIYRLEGTWKSTAKGIELTYRSGKMTLSKQGTNLVLTSPDGKVRVFLSR